jgi:hypothetical protein
MHSNPTNTIIFHSHPHDSGNEGEGRGVTFTGGRVYSLRKRTAVVRLREVGSKSMVVTPSEGGGVGVDDGDAIMTKSDARTA